MPKADLIRALALLAVLAATPAAAQPVDLTDQIRPDDRARMELLDATTGRALTGALAAGDATDIGVLITGLRGTPLPAADAAPLLAGDWSCRMLKLGGGLPLLSLIHI